jgi:hypothetical protein
VLQVDAHCLRHPVPGAAGRRPPPPSSRAKRHGLHPGAADSAEEALGDGLMEVGGGVEEAASMGGSSWGWTDGGGRRRGGGNIDGGSINGERDRVNLIIWAGQWAGINFISEVLWLGINGEAAST